MNARFPTLVAIACLLLFAVSCGKVDPSIDDSVSQSVESVSNAVGGVADDNSSSAGFGLNKDRTRISQLLAFLYENAVEREAWAAYCTGRAVSASCASNKRQASYSSCTIPYTSFLLSGTVTLTYAGADAATCGMATLGDSVTRTNNIAVSGPLGGTLYRTSANDVDFRGITIGGGSTITNSGNAQWALSIAGQHTKAISGTSVLFDVFNRTTGTVTISGSLDRGARVMNGGPVETVHNKAQVVASHMFTNVTWGGALCCLPTSGSITTTYSGNVTGSSTLTYTGCGTGVLVKGTVQKNVQFNVGNCE